MRPARDPIHARTASPHLQVVLWLSVWTTTLTVDLINPLRALMVWAWVELLNTACFTTGTSMLNRDLCLVDIAIYNAHLRVRARLLARPRILCCLRTRLAALGGSARSGGSVCPMGRPWHWRGCQSRRRRRLHRSPIPLNTLALYNCPLALQATGWHDGGFVGFRRGYLQGLPEDRFAPLHMHENTDVGPVIAVCEAFWVQEVLIEITDTVLCAVLVVYTVYIGYSHTQRVINGDGMLSRGLPSKGGRPGVRV
jgi:hypothetical protein